jgi:hypothetical protein
VRAYQERLAGDRVLSFVLGRDNDDMRTKAGIERVVVEVLVKYGFLKPAPKRPPPIRIAVDNDRAAPQSRA